MNLDAWGVYGAPGDAAHFKDAYDNRTAPDLAAHSTSQTLAQLPDLATLLNDTSAPEADGEGERVGAIDARNVCGVYSADCENGRVDAGPLQPKAQGLEVSSRSPYGKNSDRRCAGRRMPEALGRSELFMVDMGVGAAQGAPRGGALGGQDWR